MTAGDIPDRKASCPGVSPDAELRIRRIYELYHRPEYIHPDPLEIVRRYPDPQDREIAALVCSCLALGRVGGILGAAETVMAALPSPRAAVLSCRYQDFLDRLEGFTYRFFRAPAIASLLLGIRRTVETHGSLERCFAGCVRPDDETCHPALVRFTAALSGYGGIRPGILLPAPEKGSASKRLHLFLRWMIRSDEVDPGGWDEFSPSRLVVPIDTHMLAAARALGLTTRRQADLAAALEVTRALRLLDPHDPVRFDFSLTRPGIRPDLDAGEAFAPQPD